MNTGFEIEVSAVVDEASAKEAGKKLNTYVLNSLKDGYIKIPAAVEAEFNKDGKASKQLREAHREFIDQWKKMSSVGFDSSSEELDDFIEKYNKFVKLMSKEGQYNTKQNNALKKSGLGTVLRSYTTQTQKITKRLEEVTKEATSVVSDKPHKTTSKRISKVKSEEEFRSTGSKDSKKGKIRISTPENTPILDKYMTPKEESPKRVNKRYIEDLDKGAGRAKASTPGAPTNLGVRTPGWDDIYLDEERIEANDKAGTNIGKNRWMNSLAADMKSIRKKERESLKYKERNDEVIATEEKSDRKRKFRDDAGLAGVDAKENSKLFAGLLLRELAKLQGGIVHGRPDTDESDIIDQLALILSDARNREEPIEKTAVSVSNMLMNRYNAHKGVLGITDGSVKGEGVNQEEADRVLRNIYKILDRLLRVEGKMLAHTLNSDDNTAIYTKLKQALQETDNTNKMRDTLNKILQTENKRYVQDVRDYSMERIADSAEATKNRESLAASKDIGQTVTQDATTGFNADASSSIAIDQLVGIRSANEQLRKSLEVSTDTSNVQSSVTKSDRISSHRLPKTNGVESILVEILSWVKAIGTRIKAKVPEPEIKSKPITSLAELREPIERALTLIKGQTVRDHSISQNSNAYVPTPIDRTNNIFRKPEKTKPEFMKPRKEQVAVETPDVIELPDSVTVEPGSLKKLLRKIFKSSESEADRIMSLSRSEQARMYAERVETFGTNNGRQLSDTGAIANAKYIKSLYHRLGENNQNLFQNVKLTEGYGKVDTDSILGELNKVLSGSAMFKAQTGGGVLRNILGSATFYAGMPSLEKSRAEAEGLNQVMGNVRKEVLTLIQGLETKQDTLNAMVASGSAVIDKSGGINEKASSPAAVKMFYDAEEQKRVLKGALSEVQRIDEVVKSCGGNVHKIVKRIRICYA